MAGLLSPPQQGFLPGLMADPWFKLGMALLEQGGPSPKPHSVGQDISRAFGSVQAQDQAGAENDLRRMHLEKMKRDQELEEERRKRDAEFLSSPAIQAIINRGQQAALTPPEANIAPPPMEGAPPPAAMPMPQRQGGLNVPAQYQQVFDEAAKQHPNIPPGYLPAIGHVESRFNPLAKGPLVNNEWQAQGMMQFNPETASSRKIDPWSPGSAVPGAAGYLSENYSRLGDWDKALAAYGGGLVNGEITPRGLEYVKKVKEAAQQFAPMAAQAAPVTPQQASPPSPVTPTQDFPPKNIDDMLRIEAAAVSGGDGMRFVQHYLKRVADWQMQTQKPALEAAAKEPFEVAKSERETAARMGEKSYESSLKPGEEYAKTTAQENAKKFFEMVGTLPEKQANLGNINQMIDVLSGGIRTGWGAETILDTQSALQAIGIKVDNPENIGKAEFFRSNSNRLLFALRQQQAQMGAKDPNPSNADLKFQEKIIPSMGTTPTGNMLLLLQMKRSQEMTIDMTSAAQSFAERNGGVFDQAKFSKSPEAEAVFKRYRLTESGLDEMVNKARQLTGQGASNSGAAGGMIPQGAMTATGPGGEKAYSTDGGKTWINAKTGKAY